MQTAPVLWGHSDGHFQPVMDNLASLLLAHTFEIYKYIVRIKQPRLYISSSHNSVVKCTKMLLKFYQKTKYAILIIMEY
jgi:hypothetical protein